MKILPAAGNTISLNQIKDIFWVPADTTLDNTVFVKNALTQSIVVDIYPKFTGSEETLNVGGSLVHDKTGLVMTTLRPCYVPSNAGLLTDQIFDGKRVYFEFYCNQSVKAFGGTYRDTNTAGAISIATNFPDKWWTYNDDGSIAAYGPGGAIKKPANAPGSWGVGDTIGVVIDDTIKIIFFYKNNVLQYSLPYTGTNVQVEPILWNSLGTTPRYLGGIFNFGQSKFKYPDYDNLIHNKDSHPYGSIQTVKTYDSNFKPVYQARDLGQFGSISNKLSTYYGVVDDIPHRGLIKLSDFYSKYLQSFHLIKFDKQGSHKYNIPPGCTSFVATLIGAGGGGGAGGVTWESPIDPLIREDGYEEWEGVFQWYPNIAGGGGGGAGEVAENLTILTYNTDTAQITIGKGGEGGDSYEEDPQNVNLSQGKDGENTQIQVGPAVYVVKGGFGGKSASSWHLDYNNIKGRSWAFKAQINNKTLAQWNEFYGNKLIAAGSPGSNNGLSGSGGSGSCFKTYTRDGNGNWQWGDYRPSAVPIIHANNGTQTFYTDLSAAGYMARQIGIGGVGGGNKYFKGGDSGLSNTKVAAWFDDYAGLNISTGLILDIQRNGQNGAGGSGGHSAGAYADRTWWWDGEITYSTKNVSSYLAGLVGKTYTYDVYSSKNITVPADGTVEMQGWGAGGGGGGWWRNYYYYGGGGRAGSKSTKLTFDVDQNDVINVTIGAGGAGGDSGHNNGYDGGATIIKINNVTKITAPGGAGGSTTDNYYSNYGENSDIGIGGRTYWYSWWWWWGYWDYWYYWDYYWGYDYYNYYYWWWGYYDGWWWPGYWWYCWNTEAGLAAGGAGTHRWWGYYWNDWGYYWNSYSSSRGGNGFARVTLTAYPGNLGNATLTRPGGNITFTNGIFPMLKNVKPANSVAPNADLILVGTSVTQAQLTAMGIQTPLSQLTKVDPGSVVKLKVNGKVNADVQIGYWIWNANNAPTVEPTKILYQLETKTPGFETFRYNELFTVPTDLDPYEVLVFGIGDRNTKGLLGTSFTIVTSTSTFNPAQFKNEAFIASQDGGNGGDGYVQITAWNYTVPTDSYYLVPIGVSSLKLTIGTVTTTVSGLLPSEALRIYRARSGHSFITRDVTDESGGVVTLLTGVDVGGQENIKIELV